LLIEAVWKGFSMLYSFITILKAKSYPLSFLHTSLDVGEKREELTRTR